MRRSIRGRTYPEADRPPQPALISITPAPTPAAIVFKAQTIARATTAKPIIGSCAKPLSSMRAAVTAATKRATATQPCQAIGRPDPYPRFGANHAFDGPFVIRPHSFDALIITPVAGSATRSFWRKAAGPFCPPSGTSRRCRWADAYVLGPQESWNLEHLGDEISWSAVPRPGAGAAPGLIVSGFHRLDVDRELSKLAHHVVATMHVFDRRF